MDILFNVLANLFQTNKNMPTLKYATR